MISVHAWGRPGAPLLVCLHGITSHGRHFAKLAERLAGRFHVVALDLRGHGLSDMPSGDAPYATDALITHLADVLDVLGLSRASLVGHSMGGGLALHLALRAPHRVHSVVVISAVGLGVTRPAELGRALSARWFDPFGRAALRRWAVAIGLRLVYGPRARIEARNIDEYWAPSQFEGFVPAMRALLQGFRWSHFTPEELARVASPVLAIRGGHDRVVRAPYPPMQLPPAFTELLVPEAGHLAHDEAPERVNAAIIAFLDEHRDRTR